MLRRTVQFFGKVEAVTDAVKAQGINVTKPRSRLLRKLTQEDRKKRERRSRARLIQEKTSAMKEELYHTSNARDVILAQLTDDIFSRGHEFHSTACNVTYVPDGNPATPEVVLMGRSRVGKTSLLRSLFRHARAAGRSNAILRRDGMNFFSVGGGVFNIVDCPGFGGVSLPWSTMLQSALLIRNFARCRPNLKMIYYCMDVNPKFGVYIQDLDLLKFMSSEVPNFTIVLTKGEKLGSSVGDVGSKNGQTYLFTVQDVKAELLRNDIEHPVLVTSAFEMGGMDTLRFDMVMNALHSVPTERLTLSEARKLSNRLLTQDEIASVRPLSIAPTDVNDQEAEWNVRVAEEQRRAAADMDMDMQTQEALKDEIATTHQPTTGTQKEEVGKASYSRSLATSSAVEANAICKGPQAGSYERLVSKLNNDSLLRYVHETSPWRNPMLWPANIIPTKHPRKNIMRCPEDPDNPYLEQSRFVAPRADMYFRRPNEGCRKHTKKGKYEADDPKLLHSHRYTIPYFPDIVDVNMFPLPWMFLGSKEAYYEHNGGRTLGIRLARQALGSQINALSDNPAPHLPQLTEELRRLELERSGGAHQRPAAAVPELPDTSFTKPIPEAQTSIPAPPPIKKVNIAHLRPHV